MKLPDSEKLISSKEAAAYLGVTDNCLAKYRCYEKGPKYHKLGSRAIRYKWSDLLAWVEDNKVSPTSGGNHVG